VETRLLEKTAIESSAVADTRSDACRPSDAHSAMSGVAPEVVLVTDTAGVIQDCNLAAEALFLSPRKYLMGKPLAVFVPLADRLAFRIVVNRLASGSEALVKGWVLRLRSRSGRDFHVEVSVGLHSGRRNDNYLHWVLRDTAESASLEQLLRLNANVLDSMAEGVVVIDRAGRIHFSNPAMGALAGYDCGQLVGHHLSVFNLHPCSTPSEYNSLLKAATLSGQWVGEFRNRRSDGTPFVALARVTPLQLDFGRWFVIVQEDITEQRRAEEARRRSDERFALAIATINDGVWDWDLRSQTLYFSPRCNEIIGLGSEAITVEPEEWWERVNPEDRPVLAAAFEAHISGAVPLVSVEYRIQHSDGSWAWVLLRGGLVRDADGAPRRVVGSVTDITDRKGAELALREQQEELAYIGRLNLMAEMATGLAHEINQPLAAISNYAKGAVLRMESGQAQPEQIKEVLNRIAAQALRAGRIIRQLRGFIRRSEKHTVAVAIDEVVQDTIALLEHDLRVSGCSVRLELQKDLPPVLVDPIQLQQVLINLIRNAFEAISADSPSREIVICTRFSAPDLAEMTVSDSGQGLAAGHCEKVFEPFFTTKPKGLGVGLSISRSIIEVHGGRLWATPNSERGATFHLQLPIHRAAAT
jgi:two-component system sensor kinase FixL